MNDAITLQVDGGIVQCEGNGPLSYMISLWQDHTSLIASGVPIPAPLGSPAGPNLNKKRNFLSHHFDYQYHNLISDLLLPQEEGSLSDFTNGFVELQLFLLVNQHMSFRSQYSQLLPAKSTSYCNE